MADALHISVYEEHLQELSFLYEHWRHALVDWQLSFEDRVELEQRSEAHLDGLMVGKGKALDICRRQAVEGDNGELYAALRILCRSDCADEVFALGSAANEEDPERSVAISDALAHEIPRSWAPKVATWLDKAPSGFAGALARAAALRGLALGREVCQRAQKEDPPYVVPLLWALGMMGPQGADMLLYRYMQQPEVEAGRTAAIAALRFGKPQVRDYVLGTIGRWPWSAVPAALCGGQQVGNALSAMGRNGSGSDVVVALGMLGDSRQVGMMLSLLTDSDLANSAALALYLITGADLSEKVEVRLEDDSVDAAAAGNGSGDTEPDGLLAPAGPGKLEPRDRADAGAGHPGDTVAGGNEREGTGDADDSDDEHEPGLRVERITEDPASWQAWWDAHGNRFQEGVRYRLGVPFGPLVALRCLQDHRIPLQVRQWSADELAVRYGVDVPFAPDMTCAAHPRLAQAVQAMGSAPAIAASLGRWVVGERSA